MLEGPLVKRSRGRPSRPVDPGRQKIVVAARDLLRGRPRIDLHRKELAIEAGVTPALISYYFQDQASLIDAVARPVADEYLVELRALLGGHEMIADKLRSLVTFLIRLSRTDGQLIETYVGYLKRQRRSTASTSLTEAQRELTAFFDLCVQSRIIQSSNVPFTIVALWGMAKAVAAMPEIFAAGSDAPATGPVEVAQADLVLDLFMRGLNPASGTRASVTPPPARGVP